MGRLFLIPVPLGNVGDLGPRAAERIAAVDLLCCEDTRTTSRLLAKLGIPAPSLFALHDHNERDRLEPVLRRLDTGDVGLVSEAGTPVLSDPGYLVVRAAIDAGHEVVSVPGPSACVAALVGSGLPVDRFLFVGFPPRQAGKRRTWVDAMRDEPGSLVLYESPHRILDALGDLIDGLGDRPAALAVNLSKLGERFVRGTLSAIRAELAAEPEVRGELTLVVGGAPPPDADGAWARALPAIRALAEAGTPPGVIRDVLAPLFDLPRRDVYQRALDAGGR